MIERIIENWLINSSERKYQIPFCQIIGLKGYKVLHVSSHGVSEHGKDIISLDPKGDPCAFQLKAGNITTSAWRQIYPEITELLEVPIEYPCLKHKKQHRAVLVTNGGISDDVRIKITALNRGSKRRKLPQLEVITRRELLQDFISAQGSFLLKEPREIQDFLRLYLSDGRTNIEEAGFANFINNTIFPEGKKEKKAIIARKIASGLLMVKYALYPYEKLSNHISILKGWTIFCAYIFALVENNSLPNKYWKTSCELCFLEIKNNLNEFKKEVLAKNNNFLEGDPAGDGALVYKTRTTIIFGWLAAYELMQKYEDPSYRLDKKIYELIKLNFPTNMFLIGECFCPHFLMLSLFLRAYGDTNRSTQVLGSMLSGITKSNNRKSNCGLADPYYSSDHILGDLLKIPDFEKIDNRSFVGTSYAMKSIIDCLVRAQERSVLEKLWYDISNMQYCEYKPEPIWHTYLWRSEKGTQALKAFDSPQSWNKLKRSALSKPSLIPEFLRNKNFLPLFLLTYPHRLKSDFVKILDTNYY